VIASADEAELVRLVPGLMPGPVAAGSFSEHEGAVDPAHAVAVLISEAKRFGASFHHPCAITGLDAKGGRVQRVQTTSGTLETDVLVLAAGIDTPGLAAMAGVAVPLKDAPGVLAHTVPLPSRLGRVTLAPGAHVTQRFSGRVVTGSDFGGSPAAGELAGQGRGLVREAARFLPFLEGATVEQVTVGFRVMPKDEPEPTLAQRLLATLEAAPLRMSQRRTAKAPADITSTSQAMANVMSIHDTRL
jgi:glycine/D-amino acid oxidase-like deaminating enzyme